MPTLTLTDRAAAEIQKSLTHEPTGSFLRLEVLGGGCSGFQYRFRFDTLVQGDDRCFANDSFGVALHVDPSSFTLLQGSTVDYKEDLMGAAYVVINPNAEVSCGCGNSFSL
ncbi:MAG: iron-sulfur cluster assembly accessory protein [Alphaproteobacteria bacterium]|nr:MAG: iron-sulfur cluster assembly accessory protein [Alphaproteobacteria bacterium]